MGKKHKPWNDALQSRKKAEDERGKPFHTPGGDCHIMTLAAQWRISYAEAHAILGHISTYREFVSFLTHLGSIPIAVESPHREEEKQEEKQPFGCFYDGCLSLFKKNTKPKNPDAIIIKNNGGDYWHVWPVIKNTVFADSYSYNYAMTVPPCPRLPVVV